MIYHTDYFAEHFSEAAPLYFRLSAVELMSALRAMHTAHIITIRVFCRKPRHAATPAYLLCGKVVDAAYAGRCASAFFIGLCCRLLRRCRASDGAMRYIL